MGKNINSQSQNNKDYFRNYKHFHSNLWCILHWVETFYVVLFRLVFVPDSSNLVGPCTCPFLPFSPWSLKQSKFSSASNHSTWSFYDPTFLAFFLHLGLPPLLRHLDLCPSDIPLSDTRPLPTNWALTQLSDIYPQESHLGTCHLSSICPFDLHWEVFPWLLSILFHHMEYGALVCNAGRVRNSTRYMLHSDSQRQQLI